VTVPAPRQGPRARSFILESAFACALLLGAAPARAAVGVTASIWSETRLRGYSLSAGHPIASLDLSLDDQSGFYAALSGSLVASDGLKPFALQENIGFAKRLGSGPVLDVGISNSNYSHYSSRERSNGYTEAYAGLIGKIVSTHVYLSPNYFASDNWRLYGEVDAAVSPVRKLLLSAHAGVIVPLHNGYRTKTGYDWRIGAAHELGPVTLHLDLSGGGPGKDLYEGREHNRTALVAGAAFIF